MKQATHYNYQRINILVMLFISSWCTLNKYKICDFDIVSKGEGSSMHPFSVDMPTYRIVIERTAIAWIAEHEIRTDACQHKIKVVLTSMITHS